VVRLGWWVDALGLLAAEGEDGDGEGEDGDGEGEDGDDELCHADPESCLGHERRFLPARR